MPSIESMHFNQLMFAFFDFSAVFRVYCYFFSFYRKKIAKWYVIKSRWFPFQWRADEKKSANPFEINTPLLLFLCFIWSKSKIKRQISRLIEHSRVALHNSAQCIRVALRYLCVPISISRLCVFFACFFSMFVGLLSLWPNCMEWLCFTISFSSSCRFHLWPASITCDFQFTEWNNTYQLVCTALDGAYNSNRLHIVATTVLSTDNDLHVLSKIRSKSAQVSSKRHTIFAQVLKQRPRNRRMSMTQRDVHSMISWH